MPEKLFFGNTAVGTSNDFADFHRLAHFTSAYSGKITRVRFYASTSSDVKPNMYNIAGGIPTTLLWADDTGQSFTSGFNDVSVTPFTVSSGTDYAIGAVPDTDGGITRSTGTSTRTYRVAPYSTFTAPDPIADYTTQTGFVLTYCFAAYGWEPPVIDSVDDDTLEVGQTYNLAGSDFMDSGATLELCNNSDYTLATIKITQTNLGQTDTTFQSSLTNNDQLYGLNYLFITTSLGQRNATGLAVTVVNKCDLNGQGPTGDAAILFEQASTLAVVGAGPSSDAAITLNQNNDFSLLGAGPSAQAQFLLGQTNDSILVGIGPSGQADIALAQVNDAAMVGLGPGALGAMSFLHLPIILVDAVVVRFIAQVLSGLDVNVLNEFQQSIYETDYTNNYLNTAEFGITARYYHSSLKRWETYPVLFDDPHTSFGVGDIIDVSQTKTQILLSEALLKHRVLKGDKCIVKGQTYFVDDDQSDGVGSTVVFLSLK